MTSTGVAKGSAVVPIGTGYSIEARAHHEGGTIHEHSIRHHSKCDFFQESPTDITRLLRVLPEESQSKLGYLLSQILMNSVSLRRGTRRRPSIDSYNLTHGGLDSGWGVGLYHK